MQNTIYTFPSGLRMAHYENKAVRSIALGVHFGVGSANEAQQNNGISHFIEHMMFKGTEKRSALDIVNELESNGINVNAYTSKLATCYYTISIDEDIERCFDVLSDILLHSTFSEEEMKREKSVILEEISISEDDPADLCLELMADAFFGEHPLGRPILGSRENVSSFKREDVLKYYHENYLANNCCVCISGNITFEAAKALVEKYFEGKLPTCANHDWKDKPCTYKPRYVFKYKDVEQANFAVAFKSYNIMDDVAVECEILSSLLGGGMASRLFQTIREKMGLAYSVYTYNTATISNGYFVVTLSTNTDSLKQAIKATRAEIDLLKAKGINREEFERAKKLTKSGYIIGAESNTALMRAMGKAALFKDKEFNLDTYIDRVNSVKLEDMQKFIDKIFDYDNIAVSYVGREIDFNCMDVFKE